MFRPTPANEDPCQGESPKVRNPSIPQDMFQESLGELISVEQDGDDYIRPNADLEMKPQIRSKEQLKCMYSECLDGTGKFKDLNITLK